MKSTTNVVIAGLGGQGVLTCSDILAEAAFRSGWDIKKTELHGMSQRGGSVSSDIRFGEVVHSPMIPEGRADWLLVLEESQEAVAKVRLAATGRVVHCRELDGVTLPHARTLNTAMLGCLSRHLPITPEAWEAALTACLPASLLEMNQAAFALGCREIQLATQA